MQHNINAACFKLIYQKVRLFQICSSTVVFKTVATSSASNSAPLQCLQTAKSLISSGGRIGETTL